MAREEAEPTGPADVYRQFFSLERDVLVLSLAMFAFSLGFQMTNRFLPDYLVFLGATGFVVGLYATLGNIIGAVFPYYGGVVSDRFGSRLSLTISGNQVDNCPVGVLARTVPADEDDESARETKRPYGFTVTGTRSATPPRPASASGPASPASSRRTPCETVRRRSRSTRRTPSISSGD